MRPLLIIATGLFSGICFGIAVFWSTDVANGLYWVLGGLLGGFWGWYVDRKVFG